MNEYGIQWLFINFCSIPYYYFEHESYLDYILSLSKSKLFVDDQT